MEVIKFRAWHVKLKKWIDPYIVSIDGLGNVEVGGGETNKLEIEFFTGLKDRNGKEIYKGDIIKIDAAGHFESKIAIMTWQEWYSSMGWMKDKAGWKLETIKKGLTPVWTENTIEVIGNIHEDKNLL